MRANLAAPAADCLGATTWPDVALLGVGAVIILVLTAGTVAWLWIVNR